MRRITEIEFMKIEVPFGSYQHWTYMCVPDVKEE